MNIKGKIKTLKDDMKNRKNYMAVRKQIGRNWDQDIKGFDQCKVDMRIDKELDRAQILIDDNMVAEVTYHEMAVLYHFMRKCIYG